MCHTYCGRQNSLTMFLWECASVNIFLEAGEWVNKNYAGEDKTLMVEIIGSMFKSIIGAKWNEKKWMEACKSNVSPTTKKLPLKAKSS